MEIELYKSINESLLESLTFDSLLNILSWLEPEELINFGLVSKDCYQLSCQDYLWRRYYPSYHDTFQQAFQIPPPFPLPKFNAKNHYLTESKKINSISKFVGLWSEQWCDVDVHNSTKIVYDGHKIIVSYTKNKFSAEFIDFNGNCLRFKLSGGDSGWSFIYSLKIADQGKLTLNVFRIHDNMSFNGAFKLRVAEEVQMISPIRLITSATPQIQAQDTMMIDDNASTTNIEGNIESFQPSLTHRQVAF